MTREIAIRKFRAQWRWMADESERLKRKVTKMEYFATHGGYDPLENPTNLCYICEYAEDECNRRGEKDSCKYCPIDFGGDGTCVEFGVDTPYDKWYSLPREDWREAARLCREIARLPEKEDT